MILTESIRLVESIRRARLAAFEHHDDPEKAQAEYIALSRVADAVGVPAHIVTNAISNGTLPVHEVSGCKCVAVADLFQFGEGKA